MALQGQSSAQEGHSFREALAACLAEAGRCAATEVRRLEELVASLRAENAALGGPRRDENAPQTFEELAASMHVENAALAQQLQQHAGTPGVAAAEPKLSDIWRETGGRGLGLEPEGPGVGGDGLPNQGSPRSPRSQAEPRRSPTEGVSSQPADRIDSGERGRRRSSSAKPVRGPSPPSVGQQERVNSREPSGSWQLDDGTSVSPFSHPESVEEMKQLVRHCRSKKKYNVKDRYKGTGFFQTIAKSSSFEHVTLAVIIFNAVWMAIDLDLNDATTLASAHPMYQFMEHGFCVFFTCEVLVRWMSFERKLLAFTDGWFTFDLVLVFLVILEDWLVPLIGLLSGSKEGIPLGDAMVMRLFRLVRLTRISRMMRVLPELMVMVKGMLAAVRSVSFAMILMAALTYIFAIAFRQMTDKTTVGEKFFRSVPGAAYTLVIEGMIPDNGSMMSDLGDEKWYLGALFFIFLFLAALTIMNMLIGILCEVVSRVSLQEAEELDLARLSANLKLVLEEIDENYDGKISRLEVKGMLGHPEAVRALLGASVDVFGLVDNADVIFDTLELEGQASQQQEETAIEFGDFIELLQQFRGTPAAAVKVLTELRKFLFLRMMSIEQRLEGIEQGMQRSASPNADGSQGAEHSLGPNADGGIVPDMDGIQLNSLLQAAQLGLIGHPEDRVEHLCVC